MNNEQPTTEDEPMKPGAEGTETGTASGEDKHMSYPEASAILMELARKRTMSVAQVNALEMAARRILARHFQRERNWARRRAKRAGGHEEAE